MVEQPSGDLDALVLGASLELPCGIVLKNRMVKAAMSDSLGDGAGNPTDAQIQLALSAAIDAYESRDAERVAKWKTAFEAHRRPAPNE